jgi:hypothetical protein
MNENSLWWLVLLTVLVPTFFFANALVLGESHTLEQFDCPQGFYADGRLCIPVKDLDRPALSRGGQCPNGYRASGKVCVAPSKLSERIRVRGRTHSETSRVLPEEPQQHTR